MDKDGQSEVTNRLRSAIKKKLSEISEFVDDELPEYIMILVANQRSKSQIEKDLSLFLREDTVNFTNWLWSLLNSINIGPKISESSQPKCDSNVSVKKDSDIDEDAVVLGYDPDEQERDLLCHEDTNDSILSKASARPSSSDILDDASKEVAELKAQQINKITVKEIKQEPEKKHPRTLPEIKTAKTQPKRVSKEQLYSKVVPAKKRMVDSDDEYDPSKPEYVKSTTPRNYGGSAAFQANKLLLKAVDDATKSILVGQSIEDYYKPTPIKVLTSKRFQNSFNPREGGLSFKNKIQPDVVPNQEFNSDISQNSALNEQEYSNIFMDESSLNSQVSSNKGRTICLRNIPLVSDSPKSESTAEYTPPQTTSEFSFPVIEEIRPKSPHFIVTLEGVNLNSFKRKLDENSVDSMDEYMDDEDCNDTGEFSEDGSPNKKIKVSERCKYWPACKNSDNCSYHHPTVPCKCFPDCKFGDKCLYIHPNCKFDALCSRKDCPFTHASKRKLPLTTLPLRMVPVQPRRGKAVCKFYPKCTVRNCAFIHPKLCRYGTDCRLPACLFSHFPLPSRSQLKWHSSDFI